VSDLGRARFIDEDQQKNQKKSPLRGGYRIDHRLIDTALLYNSPVKHYIIINAVRIYTTSGMHIGPKRAIALVKF